MSLTLDQAKLLNNAIKSYSFPCVYFDFLKNSEIKEINMESVEDFIKKDLISNDAEMVKNGLSNVLYWGFARAGYRKHRVDTFRERVTNIQLQNAAMLFTNIKSCGLLEIKQIGLPQFSGISFISKIRMFLDPDNYVVLDKKILEMRKEQSLFGTVLDTISCGKKETQIRISKPNVKGYENWCKKCKAISEVYYESKYRAVDIERGFFELINKKQSRTAAEILSQS